MSDNDVERWVTEELHWDPKLDSNAIAVSANDGEVTLRGTVGSFREKRDAAKTAQRVYGVRTVTNDLKVRLLTEHGRDDADHRAGRPARTPLRQPHPGDDRRPRRRRLGHPHRDGGMAVPARGGRLPRRQRPRCARDRRPDRPDAHGS